MLTDEEFASKAKKVKLLILDVDGVLTPGHIIWDGGGMEIKMFNVRDGHGIKMLQRAGVDVAIISGRRSKVVDIRAEELGIKEVYQGFLEKLPAYREILGNLNISDEEVAFIGDDIVDIPLMTRVGLSFAVSDAEPYVKDKAHVVTERRGGEAAVREVIDRILKASGCWEAVTAKYFS